MMIFFLLSCKSAEKKRQECLEAAENIITEWMDINIKGETKVRLNNYFNLIDEYGKKVPYKTYNHLKGMQSDTEGFIQQVRKDLREITEAEQNDRYKEIRNYELDKTRIWYANNVWSENDEHLTENEKLVKKLCKKQSLIKHCTTEDFIWEGLDSDMFSDNLRYYLDEEVKESLSQIINQEYIIFVTAEYIYPFLLLDDDTFEPGFQCSRLKIFRLIDKNCILDKRIYAATPDEITTIDGHPVRELKYRTEHEIVLQGIKAGLPNKKKE